MRGEQAEPALRAMLDRLYEDATSFAFPEERFERLYEEVETTLYRDAVQARVVAPLAGVVIESDRVDLGGGLSLVTGDRADAPPEAAWPEDASTREAAVLCVLEREVPADEQIPVAEAEERFRGLVTALRLWAPGAIALCAPGSRRSGEGRWAAVGSAAPAPPAARPGRSPRTRRTTCATSWRRSATRPAGGPVGWALGRFEMGCERAARGRGAVRLPARAARAARRHDEAGEASLALRVAALCAEEGAAPGRAAPDRGARFASSAS